MRGGGHTSKNGGKGGRTGKPPSAYRGQRDYSVLPRSPSEALEPDRAPEPPKGSRSKRQHPFVVFLNRLITFSLLALVAVGGLSFLLRQQFDRAGPLDYPTVFVVSRGEGVRTIAERLENDGIINDRWTFIVASRYFKVQDKIKAGEYNIKVNASLRDVLDTLVEGKTNLYSVTIPEGLTSFQVVERLKAQTDLVGDIFEIPPEGSLLPDTYRVARGTSREELIRRMQGEQKKFIDGLWPSRSRDLNLKTEDEAINLAAIVEKEASRADERPRVAAVYLNRLKKRMRLDADPTIIYYASSGRGTLGRPILRSELDDPNPYNTYKNYGLPPTPIANPGRAAIEAVLKPAKSNDLYFVADGTGGHVFSENYQDHQRNVARWRVIEKDQAEDVPVKTPPATVISLNNLPPADMPLPLRNHKK